MLAHNGCLIRVCGARILSKIMEPGRRSLRVAARSVTAAVPSAAKGFVTPRVSSSISKASIKQVSAIFPGESHLEAKSSFKVKEESASEEFNSQIVVSNLDNIKRKLIFGPKSGSRNDMSQNSVSASFRARKVRAQVNSVVDGAFVKQELTDEVGKRPKTMKRKVFGDAKVEAEALEGFEHHEPLVGTRAGVQRRVAGRPKLKSEPNVDIVKNEVMTAAGMRSRKAPANVPGRATVKPEVDIEDTNRIVKQEFPPVAGGRKRKPQGSREENGGVTPNVARKVRRSKGGELFPCQPNLTKESSPSTRLELVSVHSAAGEAQLATVAAPLSVTAPYEGPFAFHERPYPEECQSVRDLLSNLHGDVSQFARHKKAAVVKLLQLDGNSASNSELSASVKPKDTVPTGHPSERRTVLDSLVGTLLSQNTTDNNSRRAFAALKKAFPTWEQVQKADPKDVENAIRCGGLAETKAKNILNILNTLLEERGDICMQYVETMSTEDIKAELSRFKGIGPKTVACVLMFHLERNEFPVDTHVFRISKMLGWVPSSADRNKTYLHLNERIPDHLKYDIHFLFVIHGKRCPNCAKRGRTQQPADGACPLVNWNTKMLKSGLRPGPALLT